MEEPAYSDNKEEKPAEDRVEAGKQVELQDEAKNKSDVKEPIDLESDEDEAGYKSDKSGSEEGSTDNIVDRKRSQGSSGYEESDEVGEEEGSDVSEGQRVSNDEAEEYDKDAVSENDSSDDVIEESGGEGETEGYEEDKEDESKAESESIQDEEIDDPKSPSVVPRRTGFWDHDNRYDSTPMEESRAPRGNNRQLWDRTVERWGHDKFVEEEQAPKKDWEIEESKKNYEDGPRRGRGRNRSNFSEFIPGRGGPRGQGRGRGRGRPERHQESRSTGNWADQEEDNDHEQERSHEREEITRNEDSSDGQRRAEKREEEQVKKLQVRKDKEDSKNYPKSVEHKSQVANTAMQKSPPATKKQERTETEPHGPRGRGRGITSKEITKAKKTSKDFKQATTEPSVISQDQNKATIHEDAEEEEELQDDPQDMKSKHQTAKPKRYSSQRQRPSNVDESHPQNDDDASAMDPQYYDQAQQQNYQPQGVVLNPNMVLLQQMQQMALQQQQQVPSAQTQGTPIMTPEMQQYMQQQFLRFQSFQQLLQQQQMLQQQQLQGMRQATMPGNESQQGTPDAGMMMQRNAYPTVSPNMQQFNMMQQTQPGIYSQPGQQYEVLVDQVMPGLPPAQQPGLYIPPVQQIPQGHQPEDSAEQYGQRKLRPAAIPIKPPPELQ